MTPGVLDGLWAGLVWATGAPHLIPPGPDRVAAALVGNAAMIAHHAQATFLQLGAGLALGTALGALTARELAAFPCLRRVARPMLVFAQAVPVFALAPLLTLWLGFGPASKIAAAALVVYFPVASCFFDAPMRLPQALPDLARAAGASRLREMVWLRVPNATPGLASGLRLVAVYARFGAVIGEWVAASRGLGYLMLLSNGRAQIDLMFAALIALAAGSVAVFFAVDRAARWLERRFGA
jgi:putative hydroxymethylpyrimidine transport system permease protein